MNTKYFLLSIFSVFCLWLFSNCSTELTDVENSSGDTYKLVLDVSCQGYSDEPDTRATGTKWEEGDKVYIRFNSTAYGVGTYSNGDWGQITIKGSKLSPISGAQCSVYYFKGDAISETEAGVTFDLLTSIYGSKNALFSYSDTTVTVSASLAPMMSRLRFKGSKDEKINLSSNFLHYSSYAFDTGEFVSETSNTILTVNEDGYSDYIYVLAPEEIQLSLSHNCVNYSKSFNQSLFVPGFSGVIQIPTEQNHQGWEMKEAPKAWIIDGKSFNEKIKALANGHDMGYDDEDGLIEKIIFNCNSLISSGEKVSSEDSEIPIYASYSKGVITINTSADVIEARDMSFMFHNFRALTSLDMSNFDTSLVTNMKNMFCQCYALTSLDLSSFNTSQVMRMDFMFSSCKSLTSLDLCNFNTSQVTDMESMFSGCKSLTSLDLSNFNTSKVMRMYDMFSVCTSLTSLDLSNFNTSQVTDMSRMFSSCPSLTSLDLSNFDTSQVTVMYGMFWDCTSLTSLDLSNFNTSQVTDIRYIFLNCKKLTKIVCSDEKIKNEYYATGGGSKTSLDTNGHEYVDLGLPSGTLWATCNVGATKPEDYGDYFAWGETTAKTIYSWSTYKYSIESSNKLTKYNNMSFYGIIDNKAVLDLEDDAAHVNWGGSWRMPTSEEQDELRNTDNCTWTWITQNGVKGYKVTSEKNGNSLFLPVAGCYISYLYDAGSSGYYWSSSLTKSSCERAEHLGISWSNVDWGSYSRCRGQSVRPVCAFSE